MKPQPRARRNEPAFLPHVLRAVARALGRPPEDVARETTQNARRLFSLPADEPRPSPAAQRTLAA
jgi:TatD DNase family protein